MSQLVLSLCGSPGNAPQTGCDPHFTNKETGAHVGHLSQLEAKTWDLNPWLTLPGNLAASFPTCSFGSKQTKAILGRSVSTARPSTWYLGWQGLSHTRGLGRGQMGTGRVWDDRGEGRQSRSRSCVVDKSLELGIRRFGLAGAQHLLYYVDL